MASQYAVRKQVIRLAGLIFSALPLGLQPEASNADERSKKLENFAAGLPRGAAENPDQWFEVRGEKGWKKLLLVLGYADNKKFCESFLTNTSKKSQNSQKSKDRKFRCRAAN